MLLAAGVVIAGPVLYAYLSSLTDLIMQNVADNGSQTARPEEVQDIPPEGRAWFGSTFDPNTLELRGRTTLVGVEERFAMVAHLSEVVDGSQVSMRVYLNDQLIDTQTGNAGGSGDVWGWSLGPLLQGGVWRYEIIDVGGNVLAEGSITAG